MKVRSVLLAMAVGLPIAGGCYTYNIIEYHADTGGGGAGSTSTSSDASATTSTGSSVSTTGSGVPLCTGDSKGFDLSNDGNPCPLTGMTTLETTTAQTSCRLWRQEEPKPWFDPGNGKMFDGSVWIDTGCSEVTEAGLGPVLFRTIPFADLDTYDYAIWATLHFEVGPESHFGGAGLLMRSTELSAYQPYAIMDVYKNVSGVAHTAIWALSPSNGAQAFGDQATLSGSFDTRIGLCYRATEKQIRGFEASGGVFTELPQAYFPNFDGDVMLGFAAHAYAGAMVDAGHTLVQFKYAGWGRRLKSAEPCPGSMNFMPEN